MTGNVHKYDMGLVGNCSYMAYIDTLANVRWLCMPRFDSDPLFGSLLAGESGGIFQIAGNHAKPHRQYYIENTNVLCTEIEMDGGLVRVTDFAPRFAEHGRRFRPNMLFRKLEPIQGTPRVLVRCVPMASQEGGPLEIAQGSNHLRFLGMDAMTRLTTDLPLASLLEGNPLALTGTRWLAFTYGPPLEAPLEDTAERFLNETLHYWRDWVKSTSIHGLLQRQVIRSALVLKLHQYEDTGALIASGSASLPESPGSGRNWDYRYCWMRDSYYTLRAFADIGHFDEMVRYFGFLENIVSQQPEHIPPLLTLTGQPVPEEESPAWPGYCGETPVRLGNGANVQQQFDVYGQMLVAMLPLYLDHRLASRRPIKELGLVEHLLNLMERDFDTPDAGIWEFRNLRQQHAYTYLFHWAGAKAAWALGCSRHHTSLQSRAATLADRAARKLENCWSPETNRYGQAVGSSVADASTLQLIAMGYLDPTSPRADQHLRSLERELDAPNGLFFRYRAKDDFGAPESAFLIAAFWRVEALACVGRLTEAREHLQRLTGCGNHLGLFSEDVSLNGGQWGNFPQTYSHVGLMNAVSRIAMREDKPFFLEDYA
ncbi:MAG TPA: glycoside hydrolase family 15 protein [Fibrobacteraceae bacterium]|nr:glycoside hydrolase family 15 protein [Fibrobacteraceae bacterium]